MRWLYFVSTKGDYCMKGMYFVISGSRKHSLYEKFAF